MLSAVSIISPKILSIIYGNLLVKWRIPFVEFSYSNESIRDSFFFDLKISKFTWLKHFKIIIDFEKFSEENCFVSFQTSPVSKFQYFLSEPGMNRPVDYKEIWKQRLKAHVQPDQQIRPDSPEDNVKFLTNAIGERKQAVLYLPEQSR